MRHKPFPSNGELVFHSQCPLCFSDSLFELGAPVKHESTPIKYSGCNACNLIFMNPRPTQEWYNDLYKTEFWEVKQVKKNNNGQIKNQIAKEALWAEKFIAILDSINFGNTRKSPHILEIGCAYGVISKLVAQHYSGIAFGVEPSDSARDFAENVTGINIFDENMDQVIRNDKSGLFDLVIFSHVLENITDPLVALQAARRLLKPDGFILLDTPNNFVRRSWHIHHPYCFTLPALQSLLGRAGLEVQISKSWSRPKYIFGPIYLTLVAGKTAQVNLPLISKWSIGLKRNAGYLCFNLFNRGPVGDMNRFMAKRRWYPNAANQQAITKIISNIK